MEAYKPEQLRKSRPEVISLNVHNLITSFNQCALHSWIPGESLIFTFREPQPKDILSAFEENLAKAGWMVIDVNSRLIEVKEKLAPKGINQK